MLAKKLKVAGDSRVTIKHPKTKRFVSWLPFWTIVKRDEISILFRKNGGKSVYVNGVRVSNTREFEKNLLK